MTNAVGGVFKLTCGMIGGGKSYKNVKDADDEYKRGTYKKIYSNIRKHAELGNGISELPDDWRECESDSLIIIDEIQKQEKFSKYFSSRRNDEVSDLSMIRHRRIDIWMISPDPAMVNSDIRNLVNDYVYLESAGKKTTKAYCFTKPHLKVSKSIKNQAYDEFIYTIEDKYCAMYWSTEDGKPSGRNHKTNIKLISFVLSIIFIACIIGGLTLYLTKDTKDSVNQLSKDAKEQSNGVSFDLPNPVEKVVSDEECRKGVNVNRPECVAYYNKLTKNKQSVQTVNYDPSKPFESTENINKDLQYEVTAKPVLSGCTKLGARIECYTQQGTIIHGMSQEDKQRIMDGDRPFNYFAQNKNTIQNGVSAQATNTSLNQVTAMQQQDKMTPEQYYKYIQYLDDTNQANNVIAETQTLTYSRDIHHIN